MSSSPLNQQEKTRRLVRVCRILGYAALCAVSLARAGVAGEILSAPSLSGGSRVSSDPAELSSVTTGTGNKAMMVEPFFVRPLMKIRVGRNDSNPQWAPQGRLIGFERSVGDKKEIHIAYPDGTPVDKVYYQLSAGGKESTFFFPGVYEEVSYNAGISWSPGGDRFVFMSNGGEGNYDLYVQDLGMSAARLTEHREKDGQADWSPVANRIVFVSGRSGNGDLYLLDLRTRALTRLTQGGNAHLYPRWSRDGRKIAMMHGSNENHDIIIMADVTKPVQSLTALTTWPYDDLRPAWSPDGRKIAFYSNYNFRNDPKTWSIIVVSANGSDPTEGEGLAAKVVAVDVVPDIEAGPAWMPDSVRIVYVKNDGQDYNPIYVADTDRRTTMPVRTDTRMNHDVVCSSDGTIAFRAQVDQWDHIFIMKLKP